MITNTKKQKKLVSHARDVLATMPRKPIKDMSINCLNQPKFKRNQIVSFVGGSGKVKSIQKRDDFWLYTIEMSQGAKPDFGRVGAETRIILEEEDIYSQVNSQLN
ncbi:MAG: hypothetical protein ACFCU7_11480 [Pleurocapsa sp.]